MLIATNPAEEHAALIDQQTPIHLGIGVTAGLLGVSTTGAVLAALAVEALALSVRRGPRYALFGKAVPASSLGNHAADVLATVGGVYLGRFLLARLA